MTFFLSLLVGSSHRFRAGALGFGQKAPARFLVEPT
jgi:hypothetical protein